MCSLSVIKEFFPEGERQAWIDLFDAENQGEIIYMETILTLLGMTVVLTVIAGKKKRSSDTSGTSSHRSASIPPKQNSLKEELKERMADFIEFDYFSLVIQPVVDYRQGDAASGEILSRLNHPERGLIFPDAFLPAVDEAGLYPQFDRYIFQKSCVWLSRALEKGENIEHISCNFSRKTLSEEGLPDQLAQIADSYSISHGKLGIEITERERENDSRQFRNNLDQLKKYGFRLYLDDYGTGVTAVEELSEYPLDVVKIDRSVLCAANTEQGKEDYRFLVAMARNLGLEVVCEGIETEEQNSFAQEAGCHYGQGFLFFRPVDVNKAFELIDQSQIKIKKQKHYL